MKHCHSSISLLFITLSHNRKCKWSPRSNRLTEKSTNNSGLIVVLK